MKKVILTIPALALMLVSVTFAADKTDQALGAKIYNQNCSACHAFGPGPIKGNKASWVKVIKGDPQSAKASLSDRPKMLDALAGISITGVPEKGMPAKGTCDKCSEADLRAAVDYMLPKKLDQ